MFTVKYLNFLICPPILAMHFNALPLTSRIAFLKTARFKNCFVTAGPSKFLSLRVLTLDLRPLNKCK